MRREVAARRRAEAMDRIEERLVSMRKLLYVRPSEIAEWRNVRNSDARLTRFIEAVDEALVDIARKTERPLREKASAAAKKTWAKRRAEEG